MNKKSESKQLKVTPLSLSLSLASSVFEVPIQPSRRKNFSVTSGAVVVCCQTLVAFWLYDPIVIISQLRRRTVRWQRRPRLIILLFIVSYVARLLLGSSFAGCCSTKPIEYLYTCDESRRPVHRKVKRGSPALNEWMIRCELKDRPTDIPPEDGRMLLVVVVEESRRPPSTATAAVEAESHLQSGSRDRFARIAQPRRNGIGNVEDILVNQQLWVAKAEYRI